jgi:hypothetical protein
MPTWKTLGKNNGIWKMDQVRHSLVKGFIWNGGSIATTTLAFMVHLKMLCCKFIALSDKIDGNTT